MIGILSGKLTVKVADRDKVYNNAKARMWRGKGAYSLERGYLFFNGKKVVKKSSLDGVIKHKLNQTKGSGSRPISIKIRERIAGISERQISKVIKRDKKMQLLNAKFTNSQIHRPVTSRFVHGRHQIDLVDFSKFKVHYQGRQYRYIMSLMDVFSRYTWLWALDNKSSKSVTECLSPLYEENGYPVNLQSDNGKEFCGKLNIFCHKHSIKRSRSRPYNPKAQGKIERMHRTLKKMYQYDLLKSKKGVNWVRMLPSYARIINTRPKRALGWHTPYEIFFGRKYASRKSLSPQTVMTTTGTLHKKIRKSTTEYNKKYMKSQLKQRKAVVFQTGEKVLYKHSNKPSGVPVSHKVVLANIVKRNLKHSTYKICYKNPISQMKNAKWVSVSDLVAFREDTPRKKVHKGTVRKGTTSKYYIPLLHSFSERDISVAYDPPGDGSCMFGAMAHQLNSLRIYRFPSTLRHEVVDFMRANPYFTGSHFLESVLEENRSNYLQRMERNSTFAGNIELSAMANLFNVRILIFSSLRQEYDRIVAPDFTVPKGTIYLGHFAENNGLHYISLDPSSIDDLDIQLLISMRPVSRADPHTLETEDVESLLSENLNSHFDFLYDYDSVDLNILEDEEPQSTHNPDQHTPYCNLPTELLLMIVGFLVRSDLTFIGLFNRVDSKFREQASSFYPRIHIIPSIAKTIKDLSNVSISYIQKQAGISSGLMIEIRKLFSANPRWFFGWLQLRPSQYGRDWYDIVDFYWKPRKSK